MPNLEVMSPRTRKKSFLVFLAPKPPPKIGAPAFDTPTTLLPKKPLFLLLSSKLTYRPSSLTVRLLVKAYSAPPPTVQPQPLLLLPPKKAVPGTTRAPRAAAAGETKNPAGMALLPKPRKPLLLLPLSVQAKPPVAKISRRSKA